MKLFTVRPMATMDTVVDKAAVSLTVFLTEASEIVTFAGR